MQNLYVIYDLHVNALYSVSLGDSTFQEGEEKNAFRGLRSIFLLNRMTGCFSSKNLARTGCTTSW